MYHYPLAVAGVGIALETPIPLAVPERFSPFRTELSDLAYRVEFREVSDLPEPNGEPLYRGESYEVYPDGIGGFARWYFDGMRDFIRFARVRSDYPGRRVLVEYISAEKELVSEMGNCFSFSGWEMLLLQERRLCLHAACVSTPLGGLLFSGPSGIGKSTQAELWCTYRGARQINGDRPILSKGEDGWLAWGSPYAGSSRCHVNENCPVTAIVMLRQAKECGLRRLSPSEAFRAVWSGLTMNSWDEALVEKACDLALELIAAVPVLELQCTPDEQAVNCLEQGLRKECGL